MFFSSVAKCLILFSAIVSIDRVLCVDLSCSEIYTVTESTRFPVLNPGVKLTAFNKVRHVKGNYIFTAGDRISGDRLLATYIDETQLTKAENVEVDIKYPAKGQNGSTMTAVEIYADLSSDQADAYFYDGGISKRYAAMLLTSDQTRHFTYEIFIYGY